MRVVQPTYVLRTNNGCLIRKQNFDGIVVDQGYVNVRSFGAKMFDFLIALAKRLHDENKVIFLVVPVRSADAI